MIIMYYDTILYKFIPGIFVLIKKKGNGYQHIFRDIIEIIQSYEKEIKASLNWSWITTDFEKALIRSIEIEIIKKYNNIKHYGCFFHYLKNIRKKFVNLGFGTDDNKQIYNEIIEFCYELPFSESIEKNIKKKLINFSKKNKCKRVKRIFYRWMD